MAPQVILEAEAKLIRRSACTPLRSAKKKPSSAATNTRKTAEESQTRMERSQRKRAAVNSTDKGSSEPGEQDHLTWWGENESAKAEAWMWWGTNDNLQCYKRRADSRRKKKATRDEATAVGVRAARPNHSRREEGKVEHTQQKNKKKEICLQTSSN